MRKTRRSDSASEDYDYDSEGSLSDQSIETDSLGEEEADGGLFAIIPQCGGNRGGCPDTFTEVEETLDDDTAIMGISTLLSDAKELFSFNIFSDPREKSQRQSRGPSNVNSRVVTANHDERQRAPSRKSRRRATSKETNRHHSPRRRRNTSTDRKERNKALKEGEPVETSAARRGPVPFEFIKIDEEQLESKLSDLSGMFKLSKANPRSKASSHASSKEQGSDVLGSTDETKKSSKRFSFSTGKRKKDKAR